MANPIHPGRILKEEIEARGMSANRLALDLGVPANRIGAILKEKRSVSADTALRLARYLGTSAQFWMNLQGHYELAVAEQRLGAEIRRSVRAA